MNDDHMTMITSDGEYQEAGSEDAFGSATEAIGESALGYVLSQKGNAILGTLQPGDKRYGELSHLVACRVRWLLHLGNGSGPDAFFREFGRYSVVSREMNGKKYTMGVKDGVPVG